MRNNPLAHPARRDQAQAMASLAALLNERRDLGSAPGVLVGISLKVRT